jgi:DNA-directed RNA polymerase subunit RPC12/RpoP
MLTSLGFGPKYVPTPPKLYDCPKCGGKNAVIKERHPDTDMNHMALVCPDCGYEEER